MVKFRLLTIAVIFIVVSSIIIVTCPVYAQTYDEIGTRGVMENQNYTWNETLTFGTGGDQITNFRFSCPEINFIGYTTFICRFYFYAFGTAYPQYIQFTWERYFDELLFGAYTSITMQIYNSSLTSTQVLAWGGQNSALNKIIWMNITDNTIALTVDSVDYIYSGITNLTYIDYFYLASGDHIYNGYVALTGFGYIGPVATTTGLPEYNPGEFSYRELIWYFVGLMLIIAPAGILGIWLKFGVHGFVGGLAAGAIVTYVVDSVYLSSVELMPTWFLFVIFLTVTLAAWKGNNL